MERLITDKALIDLVKSKPFCGFFCKIEVRNEFYKLISPQDIDKLLKSLPALRDKDKDYSCKYQAGMLIEMVHERIPNAAIAYVVGFNKGLGKRHAWPMFFDYYGNLICIDFDNVLAPGAGNVMARAIISEHNSIMGQYEKIEKVRF